MASICPSDLRPCPDDVCRGSGVCAQRPHMELLEVCSLCHAVYSRDYDIECQCEPDEQLDDDYDEDPR